jgi:formylglycine-generating enzyme required for sulfatase activity
MPQPPAKQFSGIFVSYRRDDSSGHAGRLSDRLVEHFGKDRIFMDIDTIEPGEDFVTVIENAVGSCEILIAIIGRNWLTGTGGTTGRLDNPNDFVRLEIATALSRDIRVIPVLVQRATMPTQKDLPEDLARFARRNAVELSDLRWQSDVDQLIAVMERVLAKREAAVHLAETARQSEAERQRAEDEEKQRAAAEQVRLAEEEASERAAAQRRREEKERDQREAEERARHEAREAARLRAEEERAQAEAEERDRESNLAAAHELVDERPTKITEGEVSTPAFKKRRVALIAGAALIVLVVAAVLIWRAQKNRIPSGEGNQAAAVAQPSAATQPSTTGSSGTPPLTKPSQTTGEVVQNQMGIELVFVPAGRFMMGSNINLGTDEKPVHQVTFKEGFYIGKYEVTQAQWQAVMGNNPSYFRNCGGNCPVETVSWEDTQSFINKLNEVNDRFRYRLPTEAEWEYACRAGTKGRYAGNLSEIAWYSDNSGNKTHAVGSKGANPWGLADMHGNVWEWCQDAYHENYDGAPTDGSAWLKGGGPRVLRGGSWADYDMDVRSAIRENKSNLGLNKREGIIGFRLVAVARP